MSLKGILHTVFTEFGFNSTGDFLNAVFYMKFPLFGFILATTLTTVQQFIDQYIYTPSQGILILIAITMGDVILGVAKTVQKKQGIMGTKLMRAFIRLVVQISFVAAFFEMSQVWGHMIMGWMVDALLILFTLSTFWSAFKNAKELGIITEDQYAIVESIMGLKRVFDKFKKKGE